MSNFIIKRPFEIVVPGVGEGPRKFIIQEATDRQSRTYHGRVTGDPGPSTATLTVVDANFQVTETAATATVTVSGPVTVGTTLTINGVTLTGVGVARTPGSDDFNVTGDDATVAAEIVAALSDAANSFDTIVTSSADAAVITLTVVDAGPEGNDLTLATNAPTELVLSGATFTGGTQIVANPFTTTVQIGPYVLQVGLSWFAVQGDTAATAVNLAAAISNLPGFSTSVLGSDITIMGPNAGDTTFLTSSNDGVTHFTLTPNNGLFDFSAVQGFNAIEIVNI